MNWTSIDTSYFYLYLTSNDLLNYEELLRQFNRDLQQGRSSYHKRTRASQLHQCSMISIISQIRRFTFATRRRLKFGTDEGRSQRLLNSRANDKGLIYIPFNVEVVQKHKNRHNTIETTYWP
ncbi:hypothetical protein BD777DRAFT_138158 [Yarrowia lipolytica]|nr:hypothetical protein BD777DRAFT_138158 [Yarrowia lipolytica]